MIGIVQIFQKHIVPEFAKRGYTNALAVPFVKKVVINVGLGSILKGQENSKEFIASLKEDLAMLTGQAPVETRARTSIAGFGTRKGQLLGLKVTLRSKRMIDFLERLINIALPRTKDFGGLTTSSVDSRGNLTIGVEDYSIFPETRSSKLLARTKRHLGLEITVVTNAASRDEGLILFDKLGFPFKGKNDI